MSPSEDLTFPVSYTFCLQNSIMADFHKKYKNKNYSILNACGLAIFFQIFTFIGSSVICHSLSEIPIWTHQREFGLRPKLCIYGWEWPELHKRTGGRSGNFPSQQSSHSTPRRRASHSVHLRSEKKSSTPCHKNLIMIISWVRLK